MKIMSSPTHLLLLTTLTTIAYAIMPMEHRGFPPPSLKYRGGPPLPPRPPSLPPYVKKWHMPPSSSHMSIHGGRYPHRRPSSSHGGGFPKFGGSSGNKGSGAFIHPGITLQMQHQHLQQQVHQQLQQQVHQQLQQQGQYLPLQHKGLSSPGLPPLPPITKPQPAKYENHRLPPQWPSYKQTIQQQIKPSYNEITKEKTPFLSSPQINALEYDHHIQTNSIPNTQQPSHLIKQTDDNTGPIHTIPAPKLSLADRPKDMAIQTTYKDLDYQASFPKSHHKQLIKGNSVGHKYTQVTIQKSHQYQVTEASPQENGNQHNSYGEPITKQEDQFQYQQLESLPQAQFLVQQQPDIGLQHQQLPNQDIFGVFNTVPQQPLLDVYTVPLGQQHISFDTSAPLPNFQSVVGSSHVVQPEYHSFNYQEHEHNHQMQHNPQQNQPGVEIIYHQQPQLQQQQSGSINYHNYQPNQHETRHQPNHKEQSKPYDIDFVQQFFAQHENAPLETPVRLDNPQEYSQSKEDAIVNAFYSTLPNKEAAEALASLQEAGKLNSNSPAHHQRSASKKTEPVKKNSSSIPMTIYVPDDFEDAEELQKSNKSKKSVSKSQEYLENLSAEKDVLEDLTENAEFGERIKPKQ